MGIPMKLQLALDVLSSSEAIRLANETAEYIDIIEIGTPLIKHEGISIIRKLKKALPEKELLVDLKTMDVGEFEADFCFSAGSDIVTVLGVADDKTIEGSVRSAKKHGGKVLVDLINVPNKPVRAREVESFGVDLIGIHSGIDQQNKGHSPLADLKQLAGKLKTPIAVAGGIRLDTIDEVVDERPAVIIVGGYITQSQNPYEAAKALKRRMG